ncbi:sulfotransferase family protein [Vibrio atypicus]|uniref:sulfotransferase family protein n=1 Tax=Vibrio atypicus TaxID=558271 RepID=UPI003734F84F
MHRFFIIGSPRSGTTLFRLMLNRHENLIVPPEAGFLTWLYKNYHDSDFHKFDVVSFVKELILTKKINSWNLDECHLVEYLCSSRITSYAELIDSVYRFYAEIVLDKSFTIMGDKNNFFLSEVDLINEIYPKAKFIHIVRDGRSVAVSYQDLHKKNLNSENAPKLPNDIRDIAYVWCKDINTIRQSFEKIGNPKRLLTIRFEDLVSNPEKELCKVCDFLGESFDSKMLDYYQTTLEEGLEPKEFDSWKKKNQQPLQKEEIYKFKKLSKSSLTEFELVCKNELKYFSYL